MLSQDRLTLAIDIQSRSYRLLRWVAEAIERGFIPATRAHQYANATESAYDWLDQHYWNLPTEMRPEREHLSEFANFFGTFVTTSFEIIAEPGTKLHSGCGCFCPLCTRIVNASNLQPKKLSKRDKRRALDLMRDRITVLSIEEGIEIAADSVSEIATQPETRRDAGYSAYGHWLIKRTEGLTDGTSVLALWRQIAWNPDGSPIKNFQIRYKDFVSAEESLIDAMRSALL